MHFVFRYHSHHNQSAVLRYISTSKQLLYKFLFTKMVRIDLKIASPRITKTIYETVNLVI